MQYIHREQQEYINRKTESEQKQGDNVPVKNSEEEYTMNIHADKKNPGHFFVELKKPGQEDGKGEFFGKNPSRAFPWADEVILNIDEKKRYDNNKGNILTKSVRLTKEEYHKALSEAKKAQKNLGRYNAFSDNCVDFVQRIYAASGKQGDFVDWYSKADLSDIGTMGASYAKENYGARGEAVTVSGESREEVARRFNVPIERVIINPPQVMYVADNVCGPGPTTYTVTSDGEK